MQVIFKVLTFILLLHISFTGNTSAYSTATLIDALNKPWALKVDTQSRYWITTMSGTLKIVDGQQVYSIDLPLPELIQAGQGGLLDLLVTASDSQSATLYVSYAKGSATANRLAIQKISLSFEDAWRVTASEPVFAVSDVKDTPVHYAGRMLLLPDNTLLVNSGDGFDYREEAQLTSSQLGKTLRMDLAGEPVLPVAYPDDPYLYSIGHRNAQGLALDKQGQVWQHEHGPAGGDEINLLAQGNNYGWPIITKGKDYSGALISPITQAEGMTAPIVNWTPSIAPSSMVYYDGDVFPELRGSLLIPTLKTKQVHTIAIEDNYSEGILDLPLQERLRDIAVDNDGHILLLTDGDNARLLKISPKVKSE